MPKSKHQIPGRVRSVYAFIKAHRDRSRIYECRTRRAPRFKLPSRGRRDASRWLAAVNEPWGLPCHRREAVMLALCSA